MDCKLNLATWRPSNQLLLFKQNLPQVSNVGEDTGESALAGVRRGVQRPPTQALGWGTWGPLFDFETSCIIRARPCGSPVATPRAEGRWEVGHCFLLWNGETPRGLPAAVEPGGSLREEQGPSCVLISTPRGPGGGLN